MNALPITKLAVPDRFWYTGVRKKVLIDFGSDRPKILHQVGQSSGFEATASYTDPITGKLRLYSDGQFIFHGQTHEILDNGVWGAKSWSATQAVAIVPAPGSHPDRFYIFTNNNQEIYYSIADLSQGMNGSVILLNRKLTGKQDNPGEALGVVPHSNGEAFWLIIFNGRTEVRAYLVDKNGINSKYVASPIDFPENRLNPLVGKKVHKGSIIFSPNWQKVALGVAGLGIAIAKVDRTTGTISHSDFLIRGSAGYSCAFSPDSTKLYYSRGDWEFGQWKHQTLEGWNATPHQIDLVTEIETEIDILPIGDTTGYSGPRLAPDGKIYWTGQGKSSLAVVENPNAPGHALRFNPDGLPLGNGIFASWNLPTQTFSFCRE
ncbi:hypothetical protein H6G80_07655 [Nostoc sp. FACHB-87]|uniref:hypothetical protein n=1 Tax=Nostocaceae TaxID=1162 RepID=UPI0016857074|nr:MULTISPECIES: hypothetical protein [Nostocaceae]MBD2453952.1 hypothetical protein [Nostoc sp. FACHB-87]MBD2476077.1 hypothetical protein [Anabaena sp. FACHB-83]